MKTKNMRKLALMGVAAGLISMGQTSLEADQNTNVIDLNQMIAKPSCKAHGGCGGLTAERELKTMQEDQDTKEYVDDIEETDDATEGGQD